MTLPLRSTTLSTKQGLVADTVVGDGPVGRRHVDGVDLFSAEGHGRDLVDLR